MQNQDNDKNIKSQEEDFAAIQRVLSGDNSAFQLLQNKYIRIVSTLIRRMIRDEDDVDDLTQETFIKAYRALNTFQFGYSFSAWIYKIASNNCIDFLRKKRLSTISISQPLDSSDDDYFLEIEDNSYASDSLVLTEEKMQALKKAIDSLPESYREIIKLRHDEDLDYKDIALRLDMPLGTVKAHLFRARKMLLIQLKKHKHLFQEY